MTDLRDTRALVAALLACDRVLARSPAWSAALEASAAVEALLYEMSEHWRLQFRTLLGEHEKVVAEIAAARQLSAPRRPSPGQSTADRG